ncbi:MAG: DUF3109 family protein [Melioribacteraceae bacterium]|nr:DUF3109 family protein [Melioribacteraceae bacterium]MCF8355406.1 DUF3109 family protein [Melioribacteraceae bacterium]MCF8393248.1 DUF3109 family protein [Melioribacteraceae bacterium]MCF8417549.1 DUF3109 family protein [Melioribacteraceae bacterium]
MSFLEMDEFIINREIVESKFTCDLEKCKGACCTMKSDFGAPVEKPEITIIDEYLPEIKKYLPEISSRIIEKEGFWENKSDLLLIKSVDKRDCVFVYYEGDIAKCAIEKAYFNGEIDFRKPISCHLFPIRVEDFGGRVLRYERYNECSPAVEKGEQTNLTVAEFCDDSLKRLFGIEKHQEFKQMIGKNEK